MKTDLKKLAERKKVVAGEPSDPAEAFPQHPYNRTNLFRCILPDSDDTRWVETSPEKAGQKDVLLYLGCYIMITPHLIATAREILKATGLSFEVVGGTRNCCGAPYLRAGNFEAAEEYDKRRLKLFEAYQPKDVATACTACYQYTQHFTVPTQNPAFSFKTIHKFLAENLDRLRFTRRVDAKVALHEHFGRYGEETDENYEASRRVLSRIPGIEIVEMKHSRREALSCGYPSGGGELDEEVWKEVVEAGADTLVTFWNACHRRLIIGEASYPLKVEHFITIVGRAMGFEHRDAYKEMVMSGNMAKVVEAAKTRLETRGYDLQEVEKRLLRRRESSTSVRSKP